MWQQYFKVIGIIPGRIHTQQFGVIDLSDPKIPIAKIEKLYADGCPYLKKITPKKPKQPKKGKPQ